LVVWGRANLFSFAFFLTFFASLWGPRADVALHKISCDVALHKSLAACKLETVIVQVGGSFELLSFGQRSYQNHKGL
ncbi:hypothetical protein BCR42DRAFT_415972, partial [Absidia repens]